MEINIMGINSINLNEAFSKSLLDLYNYKLRLAAILELEDKTRIYSSNFSSKLCYNTDKNLASCNENCILYQTEGLHMCQLGLWFRTIFISIADEKIGAVHVGQRLINGREEESRSKLLDTLTKNRASCEDIHYFLDLLNHIETVDQDCLDLESISEASLIKEYVLVEANRIKDMELRINHLKILAQNLAHQFLLPIQAILANSENIISEYKNLGEKCQDPEITEMIYDIFIEIKKLAYSADNLRNWMASEGDIYKYQFTNSPIHPILLDAIRLFRKEALLRGITISDPIPMGAPFPTLRISIEHMRRVFYNIISNAVKYSFDGNNNKRRYIEIFCSIQGRYYCITTTNYGIGILPEEKDKIFLEGYRGKLAKDRNRYGSGLGMGVIKKIVEDHGGYISIDSKCVDWSNSQAFKNSISLYLPLIEY
jgi:signal transduction histidine kinase